MFVNSQKRLDDKVFEATERLIVIADTEYHYCISYFARHFKCKVKWAVGFSPNWKNSKIFENSEQNNDLCIRVDKTTLQNMGVNFPIVNHQPVIFDVDKDAFANFLKRLEQPSYSHNSWYENHGKKMISLYLEHPELVPLHYRGDKLAAGGNFGKIAKKVGVSEHFGEQRRNMFCLS